MVLAQGQLRPSGGGKGTPWPFASGCPHGTSWTPWAFVLSAETEVLHASSHATLGDDPQWTRRCSEGRRGWLVELAHTFSSQSHCHP